MVSIMEENNGIIASKFKPNTFPWLFWQSQLKAAKLKNLKSMRWHPLMIRSVEYTILNIDEDLFITGGVSTYVIYLAKDMSF